LARAAFASTDLRHLARESGYSERQLRRRVLTATGHSPKRLMRIGRMQRLLLHGRQHTWARTAAEHGFFDEAHMVNDIRDLAGCTPHVLSSLMADPSKPRTAERASLEA
jgi:AraC-like DNA-binding protein